MERSPSAPAAPRTEGPEIPDEVQSVLDGIEQDAWLWRGRRHSLPGDERPESAARPLALVPARKR